MVGVESLLEALFGLVGGGHHLRVAGGKSQLFVFSCNLLPLFRWWQLRSHWAI
jgi:hypothetical protein